MKKRKSSVNVKRVNGYLFTYRFEFLLVALILVLFDKIFFRESNFFIEYVWPFNMLCLGIASFFVFKERKGWVIYLKNTLFIISVLIPIFFNVIFNSFDGAEFTIVVYVLYYILIFVEVLRQIFQRSETDTSVIFGSISGFLLIIVIAQFSFMFIEFNYPGSFTGLAKDESIPVLYDELSYFTMVTLTSVGYGDILPYTQTAKLSSMFFTIISQFYMVALVGVIISRFAANDKNNRLTI